MSVAAAAARMKVVFMGNYRTTLAAGFARRSAWRAVPAATAGGRCGANRQLVRANFAGCASIACRSRFCAPVIVPGGWDLLAFVLVFAFFIYAAQAAHGLIGSLAGLRGDADLARALGAHRLCRAHRAAHADRDARLAAVHLHLRDARRQEPPRGSDPGAAARLPAVGADPRASRSPSCSSCSSRPGAWPARKWPPSS